MGTTIYGVSIRPGSDPVVVADALRLAEDACKPCDMRFAAGKLAELRALTAHRAKDGVDMDMVADAFTRRLTEFPPDVVTAAVNAWADREEFWPSWAELKAECDKRMRGRSQVREALRRFR